MMRKRGKIFKLNLNGTIVEMIIVKKKKIEFLSTQNNGPTVGRPDTPYYYTLFQSTLFFYVYV